MNTYELKHFWHNHKVAAIGFYCMLVLMVVTGFFYMITDAIELLICGLALALFVAITDNHYTILFRLERIEAKYDRRYYITAIDEACIGVPARDWQKEQDLKVLSNLINGRG